MVPVHLITIKHLDIDKPITVKNVQGFSGNQMGDPDVPCHASVADGCRLIWKYMGTVSLQIFYFNKALTAQISLLSVH